MDLVQQSMQLEVIYGDTDSIMINTATDNLPDVSPPCAWRVDLPVCASQETVT